MLGRRRRAAEAGGSFGKGTRPAATVIAITVDAIAQRRLRLDFHDIDGRGRVLDMLAAYLALAARPSMRTGLRLLVTTNLTLPTRALRRAASRINRRLRVRGE
jgi:hypothetical protein